MYKIEITHTVGGVVTISHPEPKQFLRLCYTAARQLPDGSITGIVMTQTKETTFNVDHFEQTINRGSFLGPAVVQSFLHVVDTSEDYEKLRETPSFGMLRSNIEQMEPLVQNTAVMQLRELALQYAVREGLITAEQLLHFIGFPIRENGPF